MVTSAIKLKVTCSLEVKLWPPRHHIKKQRYYFANKGPSSQSYGFSSSHLWMWELAYKESWMLKNWCVWTVVLEKTREQGVQTSQCERKSFLNIHWNDWCWNWSSNTLATWSWVSICIKNLVHVNVFMFFPQMFKPLVDVWYFSLVIWLSVCSTYCF